RGLAAARVRGRELRRGGGAPAWARVAPGADAGIRTAFGSARAGARPCGNGFGGGPCPTTAPVPGRHGTPAGAHRRRLRNGPARTVRRPWPTGAPGAETCIIIGSPRAADPIA